MTALNIIVALLSHSTLIGVWRHHFEIIISTHRSILWWPINHPQIDLCHLTERPLPKPHKPVLSSSPSFHLHQRFSRTILVLDRSSTSPSGSEIVIFIEITIYFEIAVLRLCPLIVSLHCDFFLPIGASARQPLLREQKPHDRYDRYEHRESKYHHNVDVHSSKRIPEVNGYRRTAYARHDDSSDWYAGKQVGKERS
ncbi:hypothetical protein F2Q70_00022992 [Brassica cretica]|uniref:Uncharacterized protein n=1 Tax=Brassica cretica TaxID=69181 RepID=A0A8S9GU11_BRACR|nr:hypothetical protein F2Q70_00022992 [Brassica cretica]